MALTQVDVMESELENLLDNQMAEMKVASKEKT
jgi:hypothetical protein